MKLSIIVSLFILLSSVSLQLTPTQNTTMISLSDSLRNQTSSIPWNVSNDPCSWTGVVCKNVNISNSYVTDLSLAKYGLTDSSFLAVVCQINTLEVLDVSKNSLTSIPDDFFTICGEIQGLKLLNFSNNRIAGSLPSLSDGFTALQSLDMAYNSLAGSVETQLSSLVSLKRLDLSYNNFAGLIPVNIGKGNVGLEQLLLSANNFQGVIPEQVAKHENLTALDLSMNQISGNLPASFGNLLKLELLVLSVNSLVGEIPKNISRITTLKRFAANQNMFSGEIPAGISKYVRNLDLSYNRLVGSIPDDFLSNPNLLVVDISFNRLVGNIPANVSLGLFRLRAGGNLLNGSISPIKFGELQNLQYLELDNNSLSGTIPSELGSCRKLELLNLAENSFSGKLPTELGGLKQLRVLKLQFNNLIGVIPDEIMQLSNLSTLNISWNSLSGSIPHSVSALNNLAFLHLQNNKLTGSVPRSIGNLNNLIELQLQKNYLSGDIVSLPNIQYSLNLSHNLFEGPIPNSLRQLSSVEILDLSYNRFSGQIPEFLRDLASLTLLLLNNNNLSGECPKFNHAVVVDTKGNPNLVTVPPDSSPVINNHRKIETVKIAVGVGALFFGGLIAFLAAFFSRRFFCRAHNLEVQPYINEGISLPLATENNILSTSSIHKANINFKKAMEEVANPLNKVLNTKFSTYYKVVMPSGRNYFVKKINCSDRIIPPSSHESFGEDLEALGKLNSSNIMIPLAYMLTSDNAYLFYDLAFKGTLFDALHGCSGIPLDWVSRCTIAVGLAQGLAFLHGCSSGPILLFDLTCKTVMLKSLKEPQIADIELCKVIDPSKNSSSLSAVAGSVGYIPPEYAYTMRVTVQGNVYSFGVILLELVTGKQAVSEGTELAKWVWSNSRQPQKLDRILDYCVGRTSQAVKIQMLAVLNIALACINVSSEARPKMKSVLRMLLNVR